MKHIKILKLSIVTSLLITLIGCNNSNDNALGLDDNITVNAHENDGVVVDTNSDNTPSSSDTIPPTQDTNCSDAPLPEMECANNDNIITGWHQIHPVVNGSDLQLLPLVDMKVGVDRDVCNRILPTIATKYVSTQGDDSTADGSLTHPYRSIFQAVSDAQEGDVIMIRGGTYVETEEIRVRVPNVTITSYPNEWAVIDRSSATHIGSEDSGIYLDVDSDGSTVECLEVKGGLYAISTETKWDWDEEDKMGATNITISNVKAHDSYADVVRVKPNSDDFNITYSEIYNSGIGLNPTDCDAEGIDNVNSDRMSASHLYIHNICSNGIYFKGGAKDSVIDHSFIENTGEGGIMLGFDTSPEYFDMTANPNMYESIDCIAHHNLIKNAKGAGIGFYASKNAKAYHNTIVNSSSRFHAPIYFGITFQDWDTNAKRPANINPYIHDNIVEETTLTDKPIVAIRYSDELGGLSGLSGTLDIDYNCYHHSMIVSPVVALSFEDGRNGGWQGGFASWQEHINNDYHSKDVNPQLDINSVSHTLDCRYMGYKQGDNIIDHLEVNP